MMVLVVGGIGCEELFVKFVGDFWMLGKGFVNGDENGGVIC